MKIAFLNGELDDWVYMDLPTGIMPKNTYRNKVWRLKKALYVLTQSPRAWFGRFTSAMTSVGYKQSNSDQTLFIKHNEGKVTTLIV